MKSAATKVDDYIDSLPADRRAAVETVRKVILDNIGSGYEEVMQYGMLGYMVASRLYPDGYDPGNVPPGIVGLASQKNYLSLYMGGTYCGCGENLGSVDTPDMKWFRDAWKKTGKKLNMGKACIRFKKADELALDVIAEAIRRIPAKECVVHYAAVAARKKKA